VLVPQETQAVALESAVLGDGLEIGDGHLSERGDKCVWCAANPESDYAMDAPFPISRIASVGFENVLSTWCHPSLVIG
jgi:hypothetical protein